MYIYIFSDNIILDVIALIEFLLLPINNTSCLVMSFCACACFVSLFITKAHAKPLRIIVISSEKAVKLNV
jgi:hypothetical protein